MSARHVNTQNQQTRSSLGTEILGYRFQRGTTCHNLTRFLTVSFTIVHNIKASSWFYNGEKIKAAIAALVWSVHDWEKGRAFPPIPVSNDEHLKNCVLVFSFFTIKLNLPMS